MEHGLDFSDVLIFLAAAVVIVPLFQRLRVSPILAYLAAGALIGPHAFALVGHNETVRGIAEIGVVFLLFAIGLELSMSRLRNMRRDVFGLGTVQVIVTAALAAVAAFAAGNTVGASIVIGGGLAFSSTAMVMRLLEERGEAAGRVGRTAFAVLLFQDLAVVPFLALVPLLAGEAPDIGRALGLAVLKAATALAAIYLVGRLVLRPAYRLIAATRNREVFVGTTLLVALGTSWVTAQAGLSLALGAFLAGLLLAETEYRHQVEGDIEAFRGLFLGLFFMSVGMAIDLRAVTDNVPLVLAMVAGLIAGKAALVGILCRAFGLPAGLALQAGLLLAQGGEFAFLLFGLAMMHGVLPPATGQLLMVTVGLTMAATPGLAALGKRAALVLEPRDLSAGDRIARAAADLRDHVIVAGFGRVGQTVARLLQDHDIPYVALDVDQLRVTEGRDHGYQVFYGNAGQPNVLEAAGAARARMAVITLDEPRTAHRAVSSLRARHPDIEILGRARDRGHGASLREAGASAVVPEALEASLQLSGLALRKCGTPVESVERVLEEIRREDYAPVIEVIAAEDETSPPARKSRTTE